MTEVGGHRGGRRGAQRDVTGDGRAVQIEGTSRATHGWRSTALPAARDGGGGPPAVARDGDRGGPPGRRTAEVWGSSRSSALGDGKGGGQGAGGRQDDGHEVR